MSWRNELNDALVAALREYFRLDIASITSITDMDSCGGICESDHPETREAKIVYKTKDGFSRVIVHYGSFAELIEGIRRDL